jgi:DNA replication protein DnaC
MELSNVSSLSLPRLSNNQYDEVEQLAIDKNINLNICPTCGAKPIEVEDNSGIYVWGPSTYKLNSEEHECHCEEQTNLQRHYLLANIPKTYWTLSKQDFFGDLTALDKAELYLQRWEDMKRNGIGIEFHSPTMGTGKTMLACLIGKKLVCESERVYFTQFRDIMRLYEMPYEKRDEATRRLRHIPVLVLDEVGATISDAQRAFFAGELEDLIRYRTSGNGVTIMTTNLTPQQLDTEYPRTFSLLSASTIRVPVSGEDVRRAGEVDFLRTELALNGEAVPIA